MVDVDSIPEKMKSYIDLVVDEGITKTKVASTIIKLQGEKIEILRQGPLCKEEIENKI